VADLVFRRRAWNVLFRYMRTLISLISFNILILVFLFDVGFLKRRNRREEKKEETEERNRETEEGETEIKIWIDFISFEFFRFPAGKYDFLDFQTKPIQEKALEIKIENPYKKRRSKLKLRTVKEGNC
jgi:hypothetical protein